MLSSVPVTCQLLYCMLLMVGVYRLCWHIFFQELVLRYWYSPRCCTIRLVYLADIYLQMLRLDICRTRIFLLWASYNHTWLKCLLQCDHIYLVRSSYTTNAFSWTCLGITIVICRIFYLTVLNSYVTIVMVTSFLYHLSVLSFDWTSACRLHWAVDVS